MLIFIAILIILNYQCNSFNANLGIFKSPTMPVYPKLSTNYIPKCEMQMNIFGDAIRFFSNLNKEASAKHILIKGPGANAKLEKIKEEILSAPDISLAFSEIASKVRNSNSNIIIQVFIFLTFRSVNVHLLIEEEIWVHLNQV